jgi:hypothetical protein
VGAHIAWGCVFRGAPRAGARGLVTRACTHPQEMWGPPPAMLGRVTPEETAPKPV